jgi:protein-S-isoprenylcysteine O-methyltransferase Ste14
MPSLDHKLPPPVVGLIAAIIMWFISPAGPSLQIDATLRHTLTALFVITGLGFDLLGLLAFRAARTSVNPLRPERAAVLVVTGVYAVTRNPMYVGMLFLLLAWAVHLAAWPAFAGPILYMIYITRFQIVPEEKVLGRLFGERYALYTARVRRWL